MKEVIKVVLGVFLSVITTVSIYAQSATVKKRTFPAAIGMSAHKFLPKIVSADSLDFGSAFSPDGLSFYFARRLNNVSSIYVSFFDGNNWSEATPASFSKSKYSDADPAFSPDGKLYFISTRPENQADKNTDYNIWFVAPQPNGKWTEPEYLKNVNSSSNEFYVSFSKNANLYFSSDRSGGYGEEDIYISHLVNGNYTVPENLGTKINTPYSEYDPSISQNEDILVFASSGRSDGLGKADLYAAKRVNNRAWLSTINLGPTINTNTRDYCPYFSPDNQHFFFSSEGDIKYMSIRALKKQMLNWSSSRK